MPKIVIPISRRTFINVLALGAGQVLSMPFIIAARGAAPITIGVAGPMTGDVGIFGKQFRAGVEMALDDINAAGGVLGNRLKLAISDDASDPE
jgi:branched-chain amino acid transport system substrate-binding protein